MTYIAQDPFCPVDEWLARIKQTKEAAWYALVDTGFDHEGTAFPLPASSVNCYVNHAALGGLAPVAPVLVPLADVDLSALLTHCDGRPMLSFLMLKAGQDAQMLAQRWLPLHWVVAPDGDRLLLRFADTRVLAHFPYMLTAMQRATWQAGVAEWHYFDRAGVLRMLPSPQNDVLADPKLKRLLESGKEIPLEKEIKLDDKQFANMVDLGEADAILDILNVHSPSMLPVGIPGSAYYVHSEAALVLIRRHEIEKMGDKVFLILMNVHSKGSFLRTPELEPFLKAKNWPQDEMGKTLMQQEWMEVVFGER